MKHLSRKKLKMITNAADQIRMALNLWYEPSDFLNDDGTYCIDFQEMYDEISQIDFLQIKENILQLLQEYIQEQQQK